MAIPFLIPIATTILSPILSRLVNTYITPKILPVMEKVAEIELAHGSIKNKEKHAMILDFIENTPKLNKFIKKCDWFPKQIDTMISLFVLISKKPPTNRDNRAKWNEDDIQIVFDAVGIIVGKWFKMLSKKK